MKQSYKVRVKSSQRGAANRKKRDQLLILGQRMSNVLYNISQGSQIPDDWRATAKGLYAEWDRIRRAEPK